MSKELKPCPLCGAQFLISQEPHDNGWVAGKFYIYHDYGPLESAARKCRIEVQGHFDTREEAIAAWNTRASEADVAYLIGALQSLLAVQPNFMANSAEIAYARAAIAKAVQS